MLVQPKNKKNENEKCIARAFKLRTAMLVQPTHKKGCACIAHAFKQRNAMLLQPKEKGGGTEEAKRHALHMRSKYRMQCWCSPQLVLTVSSSQAEAVLHRTKHAAHVGRVFGMRQRRRGRHLYRNASWSIRHEATRHASV